MGVLFHGDANPASQAHDEQSDERSRQCHQAWRPHVDESARSIPSRPAVQSRSLLWRRRCQFKTIETMVHGPEPDLLVAIPAVSVCYRECSPIKTLRRTRLVLHASKRDSEDTQSTPGTLRFSYRVQLP